MSAFHSAVRGGQLAGKGIVRYLFKYGHISTHEDATYADELGGFLLAFLGLCVQIKFRFGIPFPVNVLFLPFTIIETFLVWTIM